MLLDGVKDCTITGTLAATAATITVQGASDLVGIVEVFMLKFWPWSLAFTISAGLITGIVSYFSTTLMNLKK